MVDASAATNFFNHLFETYGSRVFVVKFNDERYGYAACQKVGSDSSIFVAYVKGRGTEEEPFLPAGSEQKLTVEEGTLKIESHQKIKTDKSLRDIIDELSKEPEQSESHHCF